MSGMHILTNHDPDIPDLALSRIGTIDIDCPQQSNVKRTGSTNYIFPILKAEWQL